MQNFRSLCQSVLKLLFFTKFWGWGAGGGVIELLCQRKKQCFGSGSGRIRVFLQVGIRIRSEQPDLESRIWIPTKDFRDPGSEIRDPRSGIQDPGSQIRDPRSGIPDPGSQIRDPRSGIPDPGSRIRDPRSGIQDLESGSEIRIRFFLKTRIRIRSETDRIRNTGKKYYSSLYMYDLCRR